MSVAFRRESDDEHLEPTFEIPIPPGPNLVTARGLALIAGKVAELEAALLPLTDEAEVKKVRRALRYWSTVRRPRNWRRCPVARWWKFGSTVTFALRGKAKTITIVGDDEADPADGLVSFSAPLSRAMMGAEEGDFADFGGEADAIEIQEIRVPAA
jgi:hypothetical protein